MSTTGPFRPREVFDMDATGTMRPFLTGLGGRRADMGLTFPSAAIARVRCGSA